MTTNINVLQLLNKSHFKEALTTAEKEVYLAAYKHANGNQSKAAKLLGVSRGTMIRKANEYGLIRTAEAGEIK